MTHRVALLPGDGVGPEVIAEARRAVDALGLPIEWTELPWGSAYWHEHGRMMPEDALETVRAHDAVLMGAVGDPSVPDHVSLWGLILELRQRLDLWANLRPARLLEGIPCPLAGRGPADVDMLFVRENTEGEYSGVGGRAHTGLADEVGDRDERLHPQRRRAGAPLRVRARRRRGAASLTSATKSNASRYGYVLWDEVAEEVAAELPGRPLRARARRRARGADGARPGEPRRRRRLEPLRRHPHRPRGRDPGRDGHGREREHSRPASDAPGLFEPVHGSAPDIAGQGIANPAGAIWSAALMLEHLGEPEAAATLMSALEDVCRDGPRTRDVGGDGDDARGRRRDRRARGQRTIPMTALPATTSAPASDEPRPIPRGAARSATAAKTTAQSDCVAFSGATIETRPWSNASSRKT